MKLSKRAISVKRHFLGVSDGVAAMIAAHKHHLLVGVSGLFKGSSLGSAFKSLGRGAGGWVCVQGNERVSE